MRTKLPEIRAGRIRSGFLWRPKIIRGEKRWLEFAEWIEVLARHNFSERRKDYYWIPTEWFNG